MSALEIIEQIKALPPEEKAEVVKFIQEMDHEATVPAVSYMGKTDFQKAKERVFAKHSELLDKLAK